MKKKNKFNSAQFRSSIAFSKKERSDIILPSSTSRRIIIPANDTGTSFMRNAYSPQDLEHLINQRDFNSVIDRINSIIRKAWTKKRILDNQSYSKCPCTLFLIFVVLAVISGALITAWVYRQLDDIFLIIGFIIGEIGLILTFMILSIVKCLPRKKFRSFDTIIHNDLQEYLQGLNKSDKMQRNGIFWKVNKKRYWLQMLIDCQDKESLRQSFLDQTGEYLDPSDRFQANKQQFNGKVSKVSPGFYGQQSQQQQQQQQQQFDGKRGDDFSQNDIGLNTTEFDISQSKPNNKIKGSNNSYPQKFQRRNFENV